jgi:hypothetical protein
VFSLQCRRMNQNRDCSDDDAAKPFGPNDA